ncbi:MAG: DUF4908 domain-containing protein [Alphaproteobacteria bacterium]
MTLSGAPSALAQPRQSPPAPPQAPPVQGLYSTSGASRYSTPDGAVRFIFDRSYGRIALVRFEGDPEVHVLRPFMAAGGDEIYRTETGDVVLRVTAHGGIIVYTRAHQTGAPASEEANVAPLTPEAVAIAVMRQRLRMLEELAARQIGQPVTFDTPVQVNGPTAGVVLDAAERAAKGLADAPLTTVRRVIITIGPAPGAVVHGEELTIQVAPQMGFAGRPSSTTIRNVVTGQTEGPEQ